jgi:hypothetical protein
MYLHDSTREVLMPTDPRILLVVSNRWALTVRLAVALRELGGSLAFVCPFPGHPIRTVYGIGRIYRYNGRRPLESLRLAIEDFVPEIIIPLCDRSVQHLHELHFQCKLHGERRQTIQALIEFSLGAAEGFPIVSSRYDLLKLAKDEGIRVPETIRVDTAEDLRPWRKRPPWLLKADGTWGGRGVRRADSIASGEKALRELTTRASLLGLVKELVLNRDRDWIVSNWSGKRPEVIAQCLIVGRPANCAVVCWQGEVLAGIAVEVIRADGPRHPANVVKVVEGEEMLEAAHRIARRLRLSGFFGFDFMIEAGTGSTYLIEMNPRCTPPCSLCLGEGRDLVAEIWAKLTQQPVLCREPITQKTRIAYFPQALRRSSDSRDISELYSAYLDIPGGNPELIHELLHPWSERSLAGRLLDWLSAHFVENPWNRGYVFEDALQQDDFTVTQHKAVNC